MRKFALAKEAHELHGHDIFVRDAKFLGETPEFIYNVCADVRCPRKVDMLDVLNDKSKGI